MSKQAAQAVERGVVDGPRLQHVPVGGFDRVDGVAVQRQFHMPIVALVAGSTEVQTASEGGSNPVQSLDIDTDAIICAALRVGGLTHGQACAYMADDDGKPLDMSQWTRMRRDGNLPMKRMQKLPPVVRAEFARLYGEAVGVSMSHRALVDRLLIKVGELLAEVGVLHAHLLAQHVSRTGTR